MPDHKASQPQQPQQPSAAQPAQPQQPQQPSAAQPAQPQQPIAAQPITFYTVLHGAVGGWSQGAVVRSDELAGADVARLIRIGAIAEAGAPGEADEH